jgi:ATP-dependent Clp protease ATP-binding subunit ClpA
MDENKDFIDSELEMKDSPSNSIFSNYTNPADSFAYNNLNPVETFVPGKFANDDTNNEVTNEVVTSNNEEKKNDIGDYLNSINVGGEEKKEEVTESVNDVTPANPTEEKRPVDPSLEGMPSMIDMYGEILTDKEYVTNPAIARDEEINKMILALITPDKSAILVGKPGIGKTALVEGLAYRIHSNTVPAAISGWRIIKINIPALLGKINVNGTEVSKLQLLINEIDNLEKTILFIDEVHLLVSKNGASLDLDFANMLKPYLDRGRILMIGATTSQEYESYILRDRAFVRRFIKIDIAELTGDNVVKVLLGTIPKFEKKMGVKMAYTDFQQEKLYEWVVRNTVEENRIYEVQNRYPDICLTIISSAFSYALFENSDTVQIKHFYLAMKNTNTIYPDRIKKALDDFKSSFGTWLLNEGIDPNLI